MLHTPYTLPRNRGWLQLPGQRHRGGFDGSGCPEHPAAAAPARGSMCRTSSRAFPALGSRISKNRGASSNEAESREPFESAGSSPAFLSEPGYSGGELSLCCVPDPSQPSSEQCELSNVTGSWQAAPGFWLESLPGPAGIN